MDVNDVLKSIKAKNQFISELAEVNRPLEFDVSSLTAWDPDNIVVPKKGSDREDYFRKLARDDVQEVLNRLYTNVDNDGSVEIPDLIASFPRAKPVPKPKPPTKWEQFAARKGIKSNNKRDKLVFDDETQKWIPRYGYKKVQHDRQKNWATNYKDDQFK